MNKPTRERLAYMRVYKMWARLKRRNKNGSFCWISKKKCHKKYKAQ